MAVLPTGGGKSLCYQLPALMMPGSALVISPLISLMKDQIDALAARNIPATFINSALPWQEISERMRNAVDGRYKLIYIAPERLESNLFRRILSEIDVSFMAIDEAHCISEWGHDFRPAYLKIRQALQIKPDMPVIALTATATPEVRRDIARQLGMDDMEIFLSGFDRPNLRFVTEYTQDKSARLAEICRRSPGQSIIIYCGSRRRVEQFAAELNAEKIKCEIYHAGLAPLVRKRAQERFISGDTAIIAATSAFGMGIDKRDVRKVIHVDYTQTLEQYYQEAGRAGRDGLPADCILLYNSADRRLQEFFLRMTHPERQDILRVYDALKQFTATPGARTDARAEDLIADYAEVPRGVCSSALRIFEKSGILRRSGGGTSGRIRFTSDRERVREYYSNVNDYRRNALEGLLRSVPSSAFSNWISFDPGRITRDHMLNPEEFRKALKAFRFAGLIDYELPPPAGSLSLEFAGPVNRLPIEWKELEKRRSHSESKLETAIEYAVTHECKRNFILRYFGAEAKVGCGNCSSCNE